MNSPNEAIIGLALQQLQAGNKEKAKEMLLSILQGHPKNLPALHILGIINAEQGNHKEAALLLKKALSISPHDPSLHFNLAKALQESGENKASLLHHKVAVKYMPEKADAWLNYGTSLSSLNEHDEALAVYIKSLEIDPNNPDALSNKGAALKELKRYDEALSAYDRALELQPNSSRAWCNRGVALRELHRYDEAIDAYDKSIALQPEFLEPKFNKAILNLYKLNFIDGWPGHELRWHMKGCNENSLVTSRPTWSGAKKSNRLLIWAEQGIGDQILFASMLKELKHFPQQIIVSIDRRLIKIFTRSFPDYLFFDRNEHIDEALYDEHIPICSLGQFFRKQVSDFRLVDIPYLYENPTNLASIRSTLNFSPKIKCGISWKSLNPLLGNDKSIPLIDILKILDLKNTHYINLQYGDTSKEINLLDNKFKDLILSVPNVDNLNDIDGLLSIINACDVIITVCNSTAHLAGAAGKEVLLLTPYSVGKFWYWQDLDGTSLFYPTVKVFKQQIQGDWSSPLNQIKSYLEPKTRLS